jgi:hypothetical protein
MAMNPISTNSLPACICTTATRTYAEDILGGFVAYEPGFDPKTAAGSNVFYLSLPTIGNS